MGTEASGGPRGETEAPSGLRLLLLAGRGLAPPSQCDPGHQPVLPKPEAQGSSGALVLESGSDTTQVQFLSRPLVSLGPLSKSLALSVQQLPHL